MPSLYRALKPALFPALPRSHPRATPHITPHKTPRARRLFLALAVPFCAAFCAAFSGPLALAAEEIAAGSYLAGRHASFEKDFAATERYLSKVLENNPDNPGLLEGLMIARLGQGELDEELAQRLIDLGAAGPVSNVVVLTDLTRLQNWRGLQSAMEAGTTYVPLAQELASAWALAGLGRMDEALAAFDELSTQGPLRSEALYHKALAYGMVGDYESAAALYALPPDQGIQPNRRNLRSHVGVLAKLGRRQEALALLADLRPTGPGLGFGDLRSALSGDDPVPLSGITTPVHGVAEALFSVAAILEAQDSGQMALVYARAAEALRPDDGDILLLTASQLEALERPDLALDVFAQVPPTSPQFLAAEIGRAGALDSMGERAAAIEVLRALERQAPEEDFVPASLGDLLRAEDDMPGAEAAYTRAIALQDEGARGRWILFYAQGVARERQGNWAGAEESLRAALKLRPKQPGVLNYLGYSLVERREKLDEALEMIRTAVAVEPENGAIVDSLGWALYRLGRVEEAVGHLERAAALEPVDPVVNDHLGDALWLVGRRNEARFHWARSLSLDPEPEDAEITRQKLEMNRDDPLPGAPEAQPEAQPEPQSDAAAEPPAEAGDAQ